MKFKKSFMAATAAFMLASSVTAANANTAKFNDIDKKNQFYKEIHKLSHKGIIKGYDDGTFRAGAKVTRAQAATLIANALQLDLTVAKKPQFKDVSEKNSHYRAIAKLTELGIFKDSTSFKPNASLTRA